MSWWQSIRRRGRAPGTGPGTEPATQGKTRARGLAERAEHRAGRSAYRAAERSALAPLAITRAVSRFKSRVAQTRAAMVTDVLSVLHAQNVPAWVAGGWGVDALAGRQTRRHYDLDLVISDADDSITRLAHALDAAGFARGVSEHDPGLPTPWRHFWRRDDGAGVEVMPVDLHAPPFTAESFAVGMIDGRPVPCLSGATQLTLHSGYPLRGIDAQDIAVLLEFARP
jgi:lincosamide nucleotidyltransferase A/C/D/E